MKTEFPAMRKKYKITLAAAAAALMLAAVAA